jgi:hypothetical protein
MRNHDLPDGYDLVIREWRYLIRRKQRGVADVTENHILILDDSTSSVDTEQAEYELPEA